MADILLRFQFESGTDLEEAARSIRVRLAAVDGIADVDARPEDARVTGLEIVGAIAVGVQIVHGTRQFVAEVRRLISELKSLRGDMAGLRTIALDAGPKAIPIDSVTENDIARLSDESGAPAPER